VDALNEVAVFFERTLGGAQQQHQETKRGGK
jgi:hypothetical protein